VPRLDKDDTPQVRPVATAAAFKPLHSGDFLMVLEAVVVGLDLAPFATTTTKLGPPWVGGDLF
jgi:hypothetical protein